jgi:hypothetical protein
LYVPTERLPDIPWEDESIPAPFDLPRPDEVERVRPRAAAERLPEPLDWADDEEE